jgi:aspergillopepsin I
MISAYLSRWVFSTLQPEDQRTNRPVARVYDPSGSSAKKLDGHTWQIRYGDMSGANGQVYVDKVGVGGIFFEKQAVEAASSVSRTFSRDNANDGLLGLAFSRLNTIKPNPQKTWFDNVKPQLAAPVFTSYLKRRAIGSYDFGYIDKAKYKGDILYVPVTGNRGFWTFTPSGFSVGDGDIVNAPINAIADTGTSLWYLPKAVADAYWAKVPGAQYNSVQAGWMFPCNAKLPDIAMVISGTKQPISPWRNQKLIHCNRPEGRCPRHQYELPNHQHKPMLRWYPT